MQKKKNNDIDKITITSPDFKDRGRIPIEFTGRGDDISPEFNIEGLSKDAISISIIMNDMSHPIPAYNHWVIWNIKPVAKIKRDISYGKIVKNLGDAIQGVGYGKHRYRGPKPPGFMKKPHLYVFQFYVLDRELEIHADSRKKHLKKAMEGHIIQYGEIAGLFGNDQIRR